MAPLLSPTKCSRVVIFHDEYKDDFRTMGAQFGACDEKLQASQGIAEFLLQDISFRVSNDFFIFRRVPGYP
jgi:hypothetical protein